MKQGQGILLLCLLLALFSAACGPKTPEGQEGTDTSPGQTAELKNPYLEAEEIEASVYNVVFRENYPGEEKTTPVKVEKGKTVSESSAPNPSRGDEFTFTGWYLDAVGTKPYDFSTSVEKNLVLFAGWRSDIVTVSFHYNYVGGPDLLKVQAVNGEAVSAAEAPVRDQYTFMGWYEDASCEGAVYDFSKPVTGNVTLYAGWKLTDVRVVFDAAAEDAMSPESMLVKVGETVKVPEAPTREAYEFDAWLTADGEKFLFDGPITEEMAPSGVMTLTAGWKKKISTVTFNWGDYEEGTPKTVEVEYGESVSEPASNRSGYTVVWQLDGADYSFASPVTAPITLQAVWTKQEASDGNYTVSFLYNYEGAPAGGIYKNASVQPRRRVSMPETPEREGYYFAGWYTEPEGTTRFNFDQYIRKDHTVYAKWLKRYTFEAEYVDFTGLAGAGYSNEVRELQLIKKDVTGTCEASGGYYVTSMFIKGAHLTFHIQSDKETADAVMFLRVQAEYVDMTINPETYVVSVNGEPVDYYELTIADPAHGGDIQTNVRRPFFDYELTGKVHLNEGDNEITLLVNNTVDFDAMGMHFGTLSSYAPMLDCIYVCSDTELTWEPLVGNIDEWEKNQQ
ncbi:MAG: InlB B-repeat-containing protein [Lachnospiraceae bacterium]|nr:InlB B-repeat-containing protein [Lachnospiraceae bacterium]